MNKTIKIDKKVKMCYNTIGEIKKTLQQDKGDDTMKWTSIPTDEKETILNFDYFDNKVNLYTTNQPTGNRLKKKIGEPTRETYFEGKIASQEWEIPFQERDKLRKIFSINLFVSSHLSKSGEDIESDEEGEVIE